MENRILFVFIQCLKLPVPTHRFSPLKKCWMEIYTPVYEQMKVDVRMNLKIRYCSLKSIIWNLFRRVELKTRTGTPDISNLQKCTDFVDAFMLGFDIPDALALLRLDDLYVDSFEIKDVKTLRGEHLSRAIGRLSGKSGSSMNIKVARDSLCSLILGSPAGKVYSKLRAVTARLAEKY
ncbi:hypothetical protein M5K25_025879 [Dendrobium thyrsiflorum]|uniref:PNO1 second type I KH domain-containing protein n=1 Tax=Dendrobium thyrsiflorum TaxID=117978 RepID=A0ABD0TW03_DENTH